MLELKMFLSQFLMIYLLGFQQMNVHGRHYVAAAITSLILGMCGWFITYTIANLGEAFTSLWWFYIIAGPVAIVTAMLTHPLIMRRFK